MTVYNNIDRLINYGLQKKLISVWDIDYVRNSLFHLFSLDGEASRIEFDGNIPETPVEILEQLLMYAHESGMIDGDSVTERDLFDPKVMDILTPNPSEVIKNFYRTYEQKGAEAATKYFYQFSKDVHYIRTDRIAKNMHWYSPTEYGNLEITINLSKPEKDPKAIAASKKAQKSSYPECLLCKENVGYAGRLDHPARDNHRIIPMNLTEEQWYLQYSPYVYYEEHAIVLSREHRPMKISRAGFERLLEFTEQLPHYFVGSNADLPIVGGSILSHDHFQGGKHDFPMAKAPVEETFNLNQFEDVKVGIVKWPMSVLRLRGGDRNRLAELGEHILESWKQYSDESVDIYHSTNGNPHNTITPIARVRDGEFELDLVLRNNRTDEEHPLGIFHPHEEVHHIKKENIGLIEVMGLAVLPGRLVEEMQALAEYTLTGELNKAEKDERTAKHVPWAREVLQKHKNLSEATIHAVFKEEIGKSFSTVLEHAGVFKRDPKGAQAFRTFIEHL
ncbi:UDP-glucose--hexose-1-phosphate uridylyltransferase [Halobacillus sp. A1]|uniref:UDP-glucose--hexose-1-phosphate uridylyltransferase n=1 Tax=Halobacillus sp. A1 TaxID=2880262 RepID=UPI0020A6D39E|nr:UDP-glucose--hexose-1-phosphate uridylyltransferase [Halobacillus sp. A1]